MTATTANVDPSVLAAALDPAAPAKVEETKVEEKVEKSEYADLIERLTKGDFGGGTWDSAHNGNELDKSSPAGDPASLSAGVKTAADAEQNVDGAEGRVAASVKRSRGAQPPAPPTNLNKSDEVASDDEIDEEDIYGELVDGEGAEGYVPVAEASEAIQYLTDTFAKAFSHVSAQLAALATETHARYDGIEKSNAVQREAMAALLKSNAPRTEEPITKSLATPAPASGVVIVAPKTDETRKDAPASGALFKSIQKAMNKGDITPELGGRLLITLDSQGAAKVWENLTSETREKIAAQSAN
jgi:hypothetical protein